jgi:hypothetical protein
MGPVEHLHELSLELREKLRVWAVVGAPVLRVEPEEP